MIKMFFVRPGHFARSGGLWYEPGILMIVEPSERVEVFVDRYGAADMCTGAYDFAQLDEQAPPAGLLWAIPFMPNRGHHLLADAAA
ncbi:hypothetical protein [Vineibacter terrae]|uniref:hypothetical protein n=1 Tax=Vineibacter terrae TaxID=2586908 RepID=UPI002E36DDD6|nr:hypothetical protein [Vineibacter terrae]HEX2889150.1 hypothetical protein [Vineibacter terrae]